MVVNARAGPATRPPHLPPTSLFPAPVWCCGCGLPWGTTKTTRSFRCSSACPATMARRATTAPPPTVVGFRCGHQVIARVVVCGEPSVRRGGTAQTPCACANWAAHWCRGHTISPAPALAPRSLASRRRVQRAAKHCSPSTGPAGAPRHVGASAAAWACDPPDRQRPLRHTRASRPPRVSMRLCTAPAPTNLISSSLSPSPSPSPSPATPHPHTPRYHPPPRTPTHPHLHSLQITIGAVHRAVGAEPAGRAAAAAAAAPAQPLRAPWTFRPSTGSAPCLPPAQPPMSACRPRPSP